MRLLFSIICLLVTCTATAQAYNYVHYTEKNGLAGSNVYDMCQDKDGFMWFGTESGLSRYDGTRFTNFTTKEGLPDNEVLKIFPDSKGRVWISSFNKELSYYYKGKIYNKHNDTLLKQIQLTKFANRITEAKDSTLFFTDEMNVYGIRPDNTTFKIDGSNFGGSGSLGFAGNFTGSLFVVNLITGSYYIYDPDKKNFHFLITLSEKYYPSSQAGKSRPVVIIIDDNGKIIEEVTGNLSGAFIGTHNNRIFWLNTNEGCWQRDTITNKWSTHFLAGKIVRSTIMDIEKNIWFSTPGEGIYKLTSLSFTNFSTLGKYIGQNATRSSEVYSLGGYQGGIIAGIGYSRAALIQHEKAANQLNYEKQWEQSTNPYKNNRLYCIASLGKNKLILGFDAFLAKLDNGKVTFNQAFPIKSIDVIDSNHIIVGTANYAFKIRVGDFVITDTIWKERSNKVLYHNQRYYIGTINGLYEVNESGSSTYLGAIHPAFRRRIADIKKDGSGTLWVATSDAGIVAYRDGKIIHEVTESNGLSSDICRTLFWQPPFLWVGTNKGVSKVNTSLPNLPIITYSMADGLASNFINAIYVADNMVYVGTPAGITQFNEHAVIATSTCNLNMMAITIAGRDTTMLDNYTLPWQKNSIGFEYVAISFKSTGEIIYRYRLQGLDTGWQETRNTNISYPSLPAGDYIFQLEAVNKFGVKSKTLQITFSIDAPLWKQWWFYVLITLAAISIALWILQRRNKKAQANLEEKNKVQKQLAALEQQALQSQMNPHFIFNCLNSIQQFIVLADIPSANKYLTAFARLIQQTLDNSAKKMLSIEEELAYLSSYLELEKMRFSDRFTYTITVDDAIDRYDNWIPAMLVQPFAENSIRHGLAERKEETGLLEIAFTKEGNHIVCTITDNGIGREASYKRKSAAHIEYQSKGMSLTKKRIDLLNQSNQSQIQLTITDLYHPAPNNPNEVAKAAGTKVTLIIPQ